MTYVDYFYTVLCMFKFQNEGMINLLILFSCLSHGESKLSLKVVVIPFSHAMVLLP